MMKGMIVNVRDPNVSDMFAGMLLGLCRDRRRRGSRLLTDFEKRLRAALVTAAQRQGAQINVGDVLGEFLSPSAIAHGALAGHDRLVAEQVLGMSCPLRGQGVGRPRWKTPPLEVFEADIPDISPAAPFVVAPLGSEDGQYARWFLYGRTMMAGGVTREGIKNALRMFSHHGRTFRVLLDGRVQRVRCLPPQILFITLQLFGEHAATTYPHWTHPERRASLTRASQRFYDEIRGRVFSATARASSSVAEDFGG